MNVLANRCHETLHRPQTSFYDLFMHISSILQQPAGMAVPKCIDRWPHHTFEPFYSTYTYFGAGADGEVGGKSL